MGVHDLKKLLNTSRKFHEGCVPHAGGPVNADGEKIFPVGPTGYLDQSHHMELFWGVDEHGRLAVNIPINVVDEINNVVDGGGA